MMQKDYDLIYCPYLEIKIKNIGSEALENVGDFPLFLLYAFQKEYSLEEIASGVCLNVFTVIETAEELKQSGLLKRNEGEQRYHLTELGNQYIRIKQFIKNFQNNQEKRYAVNCFTCQLEEVIDDSFFENTIEYVTPSIYRLKNKLSGSEQLLKTPNFENVKEYMQGKLNLEKVSITEDDYKYIHFQIQAINSHKVFYVPYAIPPEAYLEDEESKVSDSFWVGVPIEYAKTVWVSEDCLTPGYEKVAELLEEVYATAPDLLSDRGKHLAISYKKTKEINKEVQAYYMDCYSTKRFTGELIVLDKGESIKPDKKVLFHLTKRKKLPPEKEMHRPKHSDAALFYYYADQKTEYIPVKINFSLLIQQGEESEQKNSSRGRKKQTNYVRKFREEGRTMELCKNKSVI